MASLIERIGEEQAEAWAKAVVANFARDPQGGDTDQLKATAAGECGVAISNHYYFARLFRSQDPAEREVAAKLVPIWPNQATIGTHVNISGGGLMANAPNKDNAVKFLEYLASDSAQLYFAAGNNEYPAVEGLEYPNEALEKLGTFKAEAMNVAVYGENQPLAQQVFDRAGWK
jgi:iron(III) transport system substrate-binding protein